MNPEILTASGRYIDLVSPSAHSIHIEDIATALSKLCRFTGHTNRFYSVAEHSVRVAMICSRDNAFAGLMHDATEAYLGDVSRPLKSRLPDYRAIEENFYRVISSVFGLPDVLPAEVHRADVIMYLTEVRDLMPDATYSAGTDADKELLIGVEPLGAEIYPWTADVARMRFMSMFRVTRPKRVAIA